MREGDTPVRYLVGTPKGRLTRLEKSFLEIPWQEVRQSVDVKLLTNDGEPLCWCAANAGCSKSAACVAGG